MATGYVYVLKSMQAPIYKIGKAAEHRLSQRLKELEVGIKNELLGSWRLWNYSESERDLHRIHKEYRIPQSEYFALPEYALNKLLDVLKSSEFKGYEIEGHSTYGYIRIDPYKDHVSLIDSDGETVAIDYPILNDVIDKLTELRKMHSLSY